MLVTHSLALPRWLGEANHGQHLSCAGADPVEVALDRGFQLVPSFSHKAPIQCHSHCWPALLLILERCLQDVAMEAEEEKDAQESSLYKEDSFRMYCMKVASPSLSDLGQAGPSRRRPITC